MKSKESVFEAVIAGCACITGAVLALAIAACFVPTEAETGLTSNERITQQGDRADDD